MKKELFIGLLFILGIIGISYAIDNQVYQLQGSVYVSSNTNTAVSVSSSAASTLAAVDYGIQRIIANDGLGTVYISKSTSTAVTTYGIPLYTKQKYVEDKYAGVMYLQSDSTAATNDVRIETLKVKF